MKTQFLKLLGLVIFSGLVLTSCNKEDKDYIMESSIESIISSHDDSPLLENFNITNDKWSIIISFEKMSIDAETFSKFTISHDTFDDFETLHYYEVDNYIKISFNSVGITNSSVELVDIYGKKTTYNIKSNLYSY